MCIIVYKPKGASLPSKDTLRTCWENNPHGAGIMWADGSNVRIQKGFMSWDAFDRALDEVTSKLDVVATPMALHFRIATHGAVKPGCCHPFAVKDSYERMRQTHISADVGFMHNGTLSGLDRRQHLRQHGFREIGARSSEEDVRRFPLRQACGARDRELDAGVALPAHGEGRARAHVRALGRR